MRGYRHTARLLKALAHPVRLAILQILREDGDCCVCHLEHALDRRQAYISQHLARLRKADLVTDRREGLNVYYALSNPAIEDVLDAVIGLSREQARKADEEISFAIVKPDRHKSCPCPKCPGEVEESRLALEKES